MSVQLYTGEQPRLVRSQSKRQAGGGAGDGDSGETDRLTLELLLLLDKNVLGERDDLRESADVGSANSVTRSEPAAAQRTRKESAPDSRSRGRRQT